MKQPQAMTFAMIREAIENNREAELARSYVSDDFVMLNGPGALFRSVVQPGLPYRIDDYRCGLVMRGEIHSTVNLIERHITAGQAAVLTPGSIVQMHEVSPDFEIKGMGVKPELLHLVMAGRLPSALMTAHMRGFILTPGLADAALIGNIFTTIWSTLHLKGHSPETLHALIAAQIHQYAHLINNMEEHPAHHSHGRDTFDRFILLVNKHCRHEHQIAFYADKMCVTERYLGTLIKKVSGITAKEWIDRAVITEAKVMLKHSSRQVSQVSDDLHFPNTSFFCKYFKRLTGMTPQDYRVS